MSGDSDTIYIIIFMFRVDAWATRRSKGLRSV